MAYDPAQAGRVGITPARDGVLQGVGRTLDRMRLPRPGRRTLLRVYVALDEAIRNVLQIDFPAGEDLPTAVDALAAAVGEERTDEPAFARSTGALRTESDDGRQAPDGPYYRGGEGRSRRRRALRPRHRCGAVTKLLLAHERAR